MDALFAQYRPAGCWRGAEPQPLPPPQVCRSPGDEVVVREAVDVRAPSVCTGCFGSQAESVEAHDNMPPASTVVKASGGEGPGDTESDRTEGLAREVGRVIREEQRRFRKEMEQRHEEMQRSLAEQLQWGLAERVSRVLEAELRRLLAPPLRAAAAATLYAVASSAVEASPVDTAASGSPTPGAERQARTLCRAAGRSRVQLPEGAVTHVAFDPAAVAAAEAQASRTSPGGRSWRSQNSPDGGGSKRRSQDDIGSTRRGGSAVSPTSGSGGDDDCPDVPQTASVALWEKGTQSGHSDCTSRSEVIHQENERWKHRWRQNLKARLSRRLHMQSSISSAGRGSGSMHVLSRLLVREQPSRAEEVVDSHAFQAVCSFLIIANAIFVGVETDVATRNASLLPPAPDPQWFDTSETVFAALFFVEVLIRISAKGVLYLVGPEWRWNLFDFMTLAVTIAERFVHIMSFEFDLTYTRLIRSFRMIRVLRLIRVLRFFRELRLMVCSICSSVVSLSWALVLCSIIIYLFTICFMHGVDRYLRDEAGPQDTREHLIAYYGTVPHTMYSLMMAISGGVDWHDMAEPLGTVHPVYQGLFAFYVLLIIIGVLNVLTSVFVQRANDLVRLDRDLVIQNQLVSNETFLREMKAIFDEVDVDGTGTITWQKFWEYMQHEEVQAYFVTQQLDTSDARELFNLLDVEHRAEVRIEDFIMGCMKLRGQARSSDVATLMRESKRVGQKTMKAMRKIERQLGTICHHIVPADASTASWWNVASPVSRYGGSLTPASRVFADPTPRKQHRL